MVPRQRRKPARYRSAGSSLRFGSAAENGVCALVSEYRELIRIVPHAQARDLVRIRRAAACHRLGPAPRISARDRAATPSSRRAPQRQANRPIDWAGNRSEPLSVGVNKVCDLGVDLLGIGDQSFLMSFSAASWASVSEAKSSGVTTLRTVLP